MLLKSRNKTTLKSPTLNSPLLSPPDGLPTDSNGSYYTSPALSKGEGPEYTPWQYFRGMMKEETNDKHMMRGKYRSRTRSKRRTASIFSCIFNMLATILGSGLLSLPYAMAGCGIWIGILSFVVIMVLSTISFVTLSKAAQVYTEGCEFKDLARDSFPTYLNWIVDFCVFINCFGCAAGYLVVMSTLCQKVIQSFSPNAVSWLVNRQLWCVVFAGFSLPLASLKNLDALKFTSFLTFLFVLFSLGVIIYYSINRPHFDKGFEPVVHYGFPNDIIQFLKVFALIANAFASSQNVPCIVNTVIKPTQTRLVFIFWASTSIGLAVYLGAAYCGYMTFGEIVDSDVLRSYPPGLMPVTIARLAITLALLGSYPVQLHPARNSFSVLVFQEHAISLSAFKYYSVTLAIWAGTLGISLITDDLGTVSTFIGALAAVPLTFIYPNWFWIKISPQIPTETTTWPSWIIFILGLLFVPLLLGTEVYKLISP